MAFDYLENSAVAGLLAAGPEAITPDMVGGASFFSQMKAISTELSLDVLPLQLVLWGRRRRSPARHGTTMAD